MTEPSTGAGAALAALADAYWEAALDADPLTASALGEPGRDGLLPDLTPEGVAATTARLHELRDRLRDVPADRLEGEDLLTRSALAQAIDARLAALDADTPAHGVDVTWGLPSAMMAVASYQPLRDVADAVALVERWGAMAGAFDTMVANLRRGLATGRAPIAASARRVVQQLDGVLAAPDAEGPFLAVLGRLPDAWEPARTEAIRADLARIVGDEVRPALARLRTFLADDVVPRGRDDAHAGIGHLEGGAQVYRSLVRAHTTTDLAPEEIHDIGLREVERIDEEMAELGGRVLGKAALPDIQAALRGDPALHFTSAEAIVAVAEGSLARANAAVPDWFGRLPRAACEVVRMLPHEERHSTIAYYRDPAADGSRPGRYYVNTSQPDTRPRYEAEALAFHEAVPGHHLQVALAQELEGLPAFRRFGAATAYVEGWGLYTERLSNEMGLYSGDLDRIGMLSFDAWRACRLVVDTGMHAMGWSRQQAIDFMLGHSALAPNNVDNEVDRYLGGPGQALAYKIGQLEILGLRDEARTRQASSFDIRRFHDAILVHGPLPLATLRESVERDLPG